MPLEIEIKIIPEQSDNFEEIKRLVSNQLHLPINDINHIEILRKSLDARKNPILFLLKVLVFKKDEVIKLPKHHFNFETQKLTSTCHVIGFGPAGIFAALQLLENGIKPIVWERGKDVHERLHDLAPIHKKKFVNPESNYCFGEGGAGTYSDGKLYTRSTKRGDVKKVLDTFIQHGADEKIGYEAHPHIGTNKLPRIIERMRNTIIEKGGEVHFNKKLCDLVIEFDKITAVVDQNEEKYTCENIILATGHSARDIFELLNRKKIEIETKPFAMGVRIEHSQELIDQIQYKKERGNYLPPATYSLVTQACGRGVFSFCMCPGGIIAPAATANYETVVNGWSASKRNGRFSNSGMVVAVNPENWKHLISKHGNLAALELQKQVEQSAYKETGSIVAPAQRVEDFIQNKISIDVPRCSYLPGIQSADLKTILPDFISKSLKEGLIDFGKKMKGYRTNEAILVGVESRTSSPVRIPRSKENFRHPQIKNLFPCGEGAGYAGGIVSAALDGISCALNVNKI